MPSSEPTVQLLVDATEFSLPNVTVDGDDVVVTVTDDGPGLPAHERTALAAGRETDLDHTSGGSLRFSVTDGTTARVTLLRGPRSL